MHAHAPSSAVIVSCSPGQRQCFAPATGGVSGPRVPELLRLRSSPACAHPKLAECSSKSTGADSPTRSFCGHPRQTHRENGTHGVSFDVFVAAVGALHRGRATTLKFMSGMLLLSAAADLAAVETARAGEAVPAAVANLLLRRLLGRALDQ